MNSDRYMKTVLTVIAACLVWIVARDVTLVKPAHADTESDISSIESDVSSIKSHVWNIGARLGQIADGTCTNDKLC